MQTTRLLKRLNVMSIYKIPCAGVCNRGKIGNREVVGYGLNGSYSYLDLEDFPYPAIRFRENTLELLVVLWMIHLKNQIIIFHIYNYYLIWQKKSCNLFRPWRRKNEVTGEDLAVMKKKCCIVRVFVKHSLRLMLQIANGKTLWPGPWLEFQFHYGSGSTFVYLVFLIYHLVSLN